LFWKLTWEGWNQPEDALPQHVDGRFVLHRHHDRGGTHFDLRLEQGGYLVGWRIDADALDGPAWASEKGPHPMGWLDENRAAACEDAGFYTWIERGEGARAMILRGSKGIRVLRAERDETVTARVAQAVAAALGEMDIEASRAADLIRDGVEARRRVIARLCGLGRELDGAAFDEGLWRKALDGLTLGEIHGQTRAYEVRFDEKYPQAPATQAEVLSERDADFNPSALLSILGE